MISFLRKCFKWGFVAIRWFAIVIVFLSGIYFLGILAHETTHVLQVDMPMGIIFFPDARPKAIASTFYYDRRGETDGTIEGDAAAKSWKDSLEAPAIQAELFILCWTFLLIFYEELFKKKFDAQEDRIKCLRCHERTWMGEIKKDGGMECGVEQERF